MGMGKERGGVEYLHRGECGEERKTIKDWQAKWIVGGWKTAFSGAWQLWYGVCCIIIM